MKVIIDIDNTLCDSNIRFALATKPNGKIDWEAAHIPNNILMDDPFYPMIDLAKHYKNSGVEVILLTGRPESVREVTNEWLEKYGVEYDKLIMRSWEDNFLKAAIYKKKMYETHIHSDVICAYDDDQTIIDMWSDLGIPSFKVNIILYD
jgi:hypothetical protein